MDNLETKVLNAIHRIEELYVETNGQCYFSFSGGKDSTIILYLIMMCSDLVVPKGSIKGVFSNTGLELGATINFVNWIKENVYENIDIIRPETSFDKIIKTYGKPLKSKNKSYMLSRFHNNHPDYLYGYLINGITKTGKMVKRVKISSKDFHMLHEDFDIKISNKCCTYMKKKPLNDYMDKNGYIGSIMGLRTAEGGVRDLSAQQRLKAGGKLCTSTTREGHINKYPIIDWTDEDVEEFIEKYNIPLSDAYTKYGMKRTGCFLCPYAYRTNTLVSNLKTLYDYEPNRYKAAMHWLKDVYVAQSVILPFDEEYEKYRKEKFKKYELMRYEMLLKYRPKDAKKFEPELQTSIFDFIEE